MLKRTSFNLALAKKHKRDIYSKVEAFIRGNDCYNGNILVLYGLRRTGKTTIMEQALCDYPEQSKCAFYEVSEKDDIEDINKVIIEESDRGTEVLFFDEITKAKNFISNSAVLSDVFAKQGIKIVVTGTDSLSFAFAEDQELFDRIIRIKSTHIPYSEHCRVLETSDIDDYIRYGGLMKKGEDGSRIVYDYESSCKYLNSAVANNISRSIKLNPYDNSLESLSLEELSAVIEKLVEKYSGIFSVKIAQNPLDTVSVNFPPARVQDLISKAEINRLVYERSNITKDFAAEINAGLEIKMPITSDMINSLKKYLMVMDVLSVTTKMEFEYTENIGWIANAPVHEYYIVQPAIKYYHLEKAKAFFEEQHYYSSLPLKAKKQMQDILENKILGEMIEQIILFDTAAALPKNKYKIIKPVFRINGKSAGEYDMLVHDVGKGSYWAFEIKHSKEACEQQVKYLENSRIQEVVDAQFGMRENVCVLYRGNPFKNSNGTVYLNIKDFLCSLEETKDMHQTIKYCVKMMKKLKSDSLCL